MSTWTLSRNRLALGVEPLDAIHQTGVIRALRVERERSAGGAQPLSRNHFGRHLLVGPEQIGASVDLRIFDHRRGYVPRRLRVPLPSAAERSMAQRTRRPFLFPGVAWDLVGGATALRGQLFRAGQPLRWGWLEGRRPDESEVVVRTRADDRGEFLLVLDSDTLVLGELRATLELDLRVLGPSSPPTPPTPLTDPLWDLPLEQLAAPGAPDPSAAGASPVPSGWTTLLDRRVELALGWTSSGPVGQLDI